MPLEDHPTDPEKVILRKPPLDQGAGYERGFVDGMQYQMQSSVDKAVNAMSQRTWVGLTNEERMDILLNLHRDKILSHMDTALAIEAKLKERNA
jgi:hypothetical protein